MRSSFDETAYLASWNYNLLGCNALTACLFCSLRSLELGAAASGVGFVLLNNPKRPILAQELSPYRLGAG